MILATRSGSNREVRFGEMGSFIPPAGSITSPMSEWGAPYEIGLTAVAAAVRLVSETIGAFVMRVYTGDASSRRPLLDAPQASVLQDGTEGYTSFDLWSDTVTSIELTGNAFVWKVMERGRVAELFCFPPEYVRVCREDGRKVIEARFGNETRDITRNVIHVRGWSPVAGVGGASTIALHQRTLRGLASLEEYRGRYFDADSTPNLVLIHPGNMTKTQRDELRESWKARHAGRYGEKTGVLWGGMDVKQLTSTMQESQVSELTDMDGLQVARMFRIFPPWLIAGTAPVDLAENTSDLFQRFSLLHRERRIERAFAGDRDLFPDRKVYSRFDINEFTRGSIETTTSKTHALVQVGVMTPNEGRAEMGLPPSDDPSADDLQTTPVGGAPNEQLQLPAGVMAE